MGEVVKVACHGCHARQATQACMQCGIGLYCGLECQRRHWKDGGHRRICMIVAPLWRLTDIGVKTKRGDGDQPPGPGEEGGPSREKKGKEEDDDEFSESSGPSGEGESLSPGGPPTPPRGEFASVPRESVVHLHFRGKPEGFKRGQEKSALMMVMPMDVLQIIIQQLANSDRWDKITELRTIAKAWRNLMDTIDWKMWLIRLLDVDDDPRVMPLGAWLRIFSVLLVIPGYAPTPDDMFGGLGNLDALMVWFLYRQYIENSVTYAENLDPQVHLNQVLDEDQTLSPYANLFLPTVIPAVGPRIFAREMRVTVDPTWLREPANLWFPPELLVGPGPQGERLGLRQLSLSRLSWTIHVARIKNIPQLFRNVAGRCRVMKVDDCPDWSGSSMRTCSQLPGLEWFNASCDEWTWCDLGVMGNPLDRKFGNRSMTRFDLRSWRLDRLVAPGMQFVWSLGPRSLLNRVLIVKDMTDPWRGTDKATAATAHSVAYPAIRRIPPPFFGLGEINYILLLLKRMPDLWNPLWDALIVRGAIPRTSPTSTPPLNMVEALLAMPSADLRSLILENVGFNFVSWFNGGFSYIADDGVTRVTADSHAKAIILVAARKRRGSRSTPTFTEFVDIYKDWQVATANSRKMRSTRDYIDVILKHRENIINAIEREDEDGRDIQITVQGGRVLPPELLFNLFRWAQRKQTNMTLRVLGASGLPWNLWITAPLESSAGRGIDNLIITTVTTFAMPDSMIYHPGILSLTLSCGGWATSNGQMQMNLFTPLIEDSATAIHHDFRSLVIDVHGGRQRDLPPILFFPSINLRPYRLFRFKFLTTSSGRSPMLK